MSDLTSLYETYAISCSALGLCSWAIAYTDQGPLPGVPVCGSTQGQITAAGLTTISGKPEPGHTYTLDYMCIRNDGIAAQTVSFGKIRMGVYYPFIPNFLLGAGEALTYVRGAGLKSVDNQGRPK